MKFPGFVLAYHGCDREVGERLLAGRDDIRISTNTYDWLGSGAYFWENNAERAQAWSKFLAKNPRQEGPKIREPFVIGAIIDPGNCLDLAEKSSLNLVKKAYTTFAEAHIAGNSELPKNENGFEGDADLVKRYLDCAVLNFLHELREGLSEPAFDTVRAPFLEGGELFPGSKLAAKSHVQWCVRDPKKSVIGYFVPRNLAATE